jgi:hypothetical protein
MRFDIEVSSSSSEATYLVSVGEDEQGIFVSCSCPAGVFGKLCKHKLEVLNSASSVAEGDSDVVSDDIHGLIGSSDISRLLKALNLADVNFQSAKQALESAKRDLEKTLNGGRSRK